MTITITAASTLHIAAIPPELAATFAPATQLLYEWTDYLIDAPGATMLRVGDQLLKPIRSGLFTLRFENQLGRTTIQPYANHRPLAPAPAGATVERHSGEPRAIVDALSRRGFRHLYVDGGETIQQFLAAGCVQRLVVTRVPVLIGEGISLFGPLPADLRLRHVATRAFASGLVQSEYEILD